MRRQLVRLHRWFGVAIAPFLFVAGLTGAIIARDHELDAALNPSFYRARTAGPTLSGLELANRVEAADPRLQVTYLPLAVEPGHTLQMMVLPRTDPATKRPYPLEFNQIAVDPVTGEIQGRREWGAVSLTRLNLIPFTYKLHYTLQLPFTGGIDIGTWLMGIVGIVWLFDSKERIAPASTGAVFIGATFSGTPPSCCRSTRRDARRATSPRAQASHTRRRGRSPSVVPASCCGPRARPPAR
ncbi:putative iron-regulated membrane protein [Paraburkholderia sp. WC7.3d]